MLIYYGYNNVKHATGELQALTFPYHDVATIKLILEHAAQLMAILLPCDCTDVGVLRI